MKKILEIFNEFKEIDIAKDMMESLKSVKKSGKIEWNFQKQNFLKETLTAAIVDNISNRQVLLNTGDAILAECIEDDLDLGTGMKKGEPDGKTISKWRGRNILGYTLMQIREEIRSGADLTPSISPITLSIMKGDITKLEVDAIVNAANSTLLGGGGVDGAIHRCAGPELLEECRKLNGAQTGEAKMTFGYKLPAKHVIHTVGPIWHGGMDNEPQKLADCYRHSLGLAYENDLHSIAFPSISTGAYRFPVEKAAHIAMETIVEFLQFHPDANMKVIFIAFDDYTKKVYEEALISVLKELVYANAIDLYDDTVTGIDPETLGAFILAETGAMGTPGTIGLYLVSDDGMDVLFGNFMEGVLNIKSLQERFPVFKELDVGVCGGSSVPQGWQDFYMGMGNHLVARSDIAEILENYLKNKECEWLYDCHDALLLSAVFNRKN